MSTNREAKRRTRRRSRGREADRRYGPDTSEVIFAYEDGWTIRRPHTMADLQRLGFLLHNCLIDADDRLPTEATRFLADGLGHPRVIFNVYDVHGGLCTDIVANDQRPAQPEHLERLAAWPGCGELLATWWVAGTDGLQEVKMFTLEPAPS